jgi:hypothetical protein
VTLGGLLDHARGQGCRVRPVAQEGGHLYRGMLYLLDCDSGLRQTSVTGAPDDEMEPEVVERVCRQLRIPPP